MKKASKTRIPKFRSFREEAEFWDSRDTTQFLNELKPAKLKFPKSRKKLISMRMPEAEITGLKKIAAQKGVGYLTLMRVWVTERLFQEIEQVRKAA